MRPSSLTRAVALAAILLADCVLGKRIIWSYRVCSELEAKAILKAPEAPLRRDPRYDIQASKWQTGFGIYASPSPGEYQPPGSSNWFMVIEVEEKEIFHVPKHWMPPEMDEMPEEVIQKYLESKGLLPEMTLRYSLMRPPGLRYQAMIPTVFLNDEDRIINFYAKVYKNLQDVPFVHIDYLDEKVWGKISGTPPLGAAPPAKGAGRKSPSPRRKSPSPNGPRGRKVKRGSIESSGARL